MRIPALCLAALVTAGCVAQTPQEADAARRGRDDARRDVARGRPRRAVVGFLRDDESPLDLATGLVKFSVGCCNTRDAAAYRAGYQEVVDDAVAAGRLSGAALVRKATTRDAVAARFAGSAGAEVRIGGAGIESPDARFRIEAAPASGVYGVGLWEVDLAGGDREELRRIGADRVVVVFGENDMLFVRDAAAGVYATFDLPTALPLQVFSDRAAAR